MALRSRRVKSKSRLQLSILLLAWLAVFKFHVYRTQNIRTSEVTKAILSSCAQSGHKFVTLLYSNDAYVNLTKSFLCNLNTVAISPSVSRLVVVAGDEQAAYHLKEFLLTEQLHHLRRTMSPFIVHLYSGEAQAVDFGTRRYYDMTLERLNIQNQLLQAGFNVFVVESDAIWFSAGIGDILNEAFSGDVDIVSANDAGGSASKLISAGFLAVKSNQKVKKLFQIYTSRYRKLLKKKQLVGEQILMTHLLQEFPDVNVKWLDECEYASGRWYSEIEYRKRCETPAVLQNNWIIGVDRKCTERNSGNTGFFEAMERAL